MLVIHKSGAIEVNCPHCKHGVFVPLMLQAGSFELRKAIEPRLVVSKSVDSPKRDPTQ